MKKTLPANTNLDTPQAEPVTEPAGIQPHPTQSFTRKVHKNTILFLPIVLLFVAGIALVLLSQQKTQDMRSRAAVTGPTLALSPATKTVAVGDSFTVGATMNTDTDTVSAAILDLSYDPTAIQVLSFTPGTVLPVVLSPETHTNGRISVTLGASPTSPFKGADIVGTWTMKMIAAAPSSQPSIKFTDTTAVAALGKTTNALVSKMGSTITVSGTAVTHLPTSRSTLPQVGCSPNGSTCTIPYCPPMPPCPVGRECTQVMPPCSDQDGICQNNKCVPYTSVAPIPTRRPTPTCIPRPPCLDATPRCLIPETTDMCPPTTKIPTPTPQPGCYYKDVQCFQAPCTPLLVCPTPTPKPLICALYFRTDTSDQMIQGTWDDSATSTSSIKACYEYMSINIFTKPYCAQPGNAVYATAVLIKNSRHTFVMPTDINMSTEYVMGDYCPKPLTPTPILTPTITPTPVWHPWWWNWWDNWRHGRSWWNK